jgi:hypothetical protein
MDEKVTKMEKTTEVCSFCWRGATVWAGKSRYPFRWSDGAVYHEDCRKRADEILSEI